jgi:selenocysteine lyase/cysteine desulfurase
MPRELPDRAEAGTANVPGAAGLAAGLRYLQQTGVETIGRREKAQADLCVRELEKLGLQVFSGDHRSGTVSFVTKTDCEEAALAFAGQGIGLRAGLHCAPLAHESAGTLDTGTLRISFGHDASGRQSAEFLRAAKTLKIRGEI